MMKKYFFLVIVLSTFFLSPSIAQKITPDSLQARIILIGDAGELTKGRQPVLSGVKSTLSMDAKTTIIYLGDNVYNTGLPDDASPSYPAMRAVLDSQIHIADGTKAKIYIMPGNHDWNNGNPGGWETIVRQQQYVDGAGLPNVQFYPKDGCAGPVEIKISDDVTLIIMDSQWWVHPYDKPGIESDCPYKTKDEVLAQLDDILSRNSKKMVLLTFHHTLRSYGIHGGYFPFTQLFFPFTDVFPKLGYFLLPLFPPPISFSYSIARGIFGTTEDLSHPAYASMIADIDKVVKGHQNVVFASGHEHTLQLIKDSSYYYMVSGAASKSTRVKKNKKLLYGAQKNGFATLDISKNKNVNATYYTVDSNKVTQSFTSNLFNFSTIPTPQNPNDTTRQVEVAFKDSVLISASDKYKNPTGFKMAFLGKNYREEWSTPIKLKVFNLRKEKGGFTIASLGGGQHTRSLRLVDKKGKEYNLRSVDKDPEKSIPTNLQGTLAQDIVQDLTSASNPYAPYVIPGLAKATGVYESTPEFFFIPDDPAFGIYQKMFANTVCMLEVKESTPDATDTKSTAKIINKMFEDHDNHVNQRGYLNARLLDNLIGDWERHFDQWKWGTSDTGKGKLYYPVPKDRDQAFFNSDGILVNYLSANHFKYLQGFKKHIYNMKWLNYEARDIDRIFMNGLSIEDWKSTIDSFQHNLTDAVIESSLKKLPPEIYPMDAGKISEKLKSRRDELMRKGIRYYNFLSKTVNVLGSNQQEYFKVQKADNGLQVIVYRKRKNADSAGIIYNRTFDDKITREIRLYGLNGNDKFEVADDASSKIKLRIIGGKGNDSFNIKGNVRNFIYDIVSTDSTSEKNGITNSSKSKIQLSADPLVNEYKPYGYNYNTVHFPQLVLGYNEEDKLLIGFGIDAKTFGFRKDPYATYQKMSTLYAPVSGAYHLKYQGIFNELFLKKDILVNAEMVNPTLNNFFGFGNSTVIDKSKPIEFYRVRYKYLKADLLLRKRFNSFFDVSIGPAFQHYWADYTDNSDRILGKPSFIGSDSQTVYANKDYFGAKLKMDINFVNNDLLPTRGVTWYNEFSSMAGVNSHSNAITKFTSDMTIYGSFNDENKIVLTFRVGGGKIFTKNIQYFQAMTLGVNNYLRGFRKDRFAGTSSLYSSLEARVKLFKSKFYILPGDFGLLGFYDVGRVWLHAESSTKWHQSFGGGLYYSPFNILAVSATVGISDEDKLLNFSLGTKFRLTF